MRDKHAGRLVAEEGQEAEGRPEPLVTDEVLPALGRRLGGAPVVAERLVPDLPGRLRELGRVPGDPGALGERPPGTAPVRSRLMKWNQRACW